MNQTPTQVFIWLLDLPQLNNEIYIPLLNEEESERYHRFLDKKKAHEFACTRGSLRIALAKYAGANVGPKDILFTYTADKKPICQNYPQLAFNVSHSNDAALIAVNSNELSIGIDIEAHRKVDIAGLSCRFFSALEQKLLLEIKEPTEQRLAFFNIWSRKEACVKAFGKGIATGLASFSVNYAEDAQILESSAYINPNGHWSLLSIAARQNFSAALACCGPATFQMQSKQNLCPIL